MRLIILGQSLEGDYDVESLANETCVRVAVLEN